MPNLNPAPDVLDFAPSLVVFREPSPLKVALERRLTVIEAGVRSGRVTKCCTPPEPAGTIGSFCGPIDPNGVITVKWKLPFEPPTMFSPVVTVTVSPAANGWLGMKLPPCPSESAWIEPVCDPLVEPTTCTDPIWLAGTPRKVICVCGSALEVPGAT